MAQFRRSSSCARLLVALAASSVGALVTVRAQAPVPVAGRNINMVSGTNFPDGDPFLQRQNEPSLAVSTRNPLHILAGANDYRTVDLPGLPNEITGDAWLGLFKSVDGGATWFSTLLPGFPQDKSPEGAASPLHGLQAAADPVVRVGTNGLFYYAGIAFNRDTNVGSKSFVARFIDNNNNEGRYFVDAKGAHNDPIAYLGTTVVDVGSSNRFIDKPALVVDIPRGGKSGSTCTITQGSATQTIPAGTVYIIYSLFADHDHGEADENRPPGSPAEGHTKILVTRSTNCGVTFDSPTLVSDRLSINQGSAAAIDPNTGALWIAWREFKSKKGSDGLIVTRSTDGGKTFSSPVRVATMTPFDQNSTTTPLTFRTNAYPTITVAPGANGAAGRAYVAWTQRGVGPQGDARIVVTSSTDGTNWTNLVAADNTLDPAKAWRGHQIMPVLTFGGGRLQLVYKDFRNDASRLFNTFITDTDVNTWNAQHPNDLRKRHTVDIRAAQAFPGNPVQFGPSIQVSEYLNGSRKREKTGIGPIEQLQFNPSNLPLFAKGTTPFVGDYIDVAASPMFIANPDGTWRYNTLTSDPAVYITAWGDNRDVRAPAPPKTWVDYTPPTYVGSNGSSIFDPTQPVIECSAGTAGMRNQNIYSARLLSGLVVGTLGNNKPLGSVIVNGKSQLAQRSFVVVVTNADAFKKSVTLHINAQAPTQASFQQFKSLIDLDVDLAPKSTISREVYVRSPDKRGSASITITTKGTSTLLGNVVLNPDITNPDIANPDFANPDIANPDIANAEAHALTVSTPAIANPDIANPDITNPDIANPDFANPSIANPDIANPDFANPDIANPDIANPDIANPDIANPDFANPDIANGSLTDINWTVVNQGNTATSYSVKLLLRDAAKHNLLQAGYKFQMVVRKLTAAPIAVGCTVVQPPQNVIVANITGAACDSTVNPQCQDVFVDPTKPDQFATIVNPDIANPDITNTTLALAPGETGKVTLRVLTPFRTSTGANAAGDGPSAADGATPQFDDLLGELSKVGLASSAQAVDTQDANAGSTTPQIQSSTPLIITTTLPDGTHGAPYGDPTQLDLVARIESVGGNPPRSVSITGGALPPGLFLDSATGAITGAPTASGSFTFTATVTCTNCIAFDQQLTIRIFEPLLVATASVPAGTVNQLYAPAQIAATGGLPPYAFAVTGGALPNGVALNAAGQLTGTPTQSGSFAFTVTARDSAVSPQARSAALTLNIAPAANPQSATASEDAANGLTLTGTGAAQTAFSFNVSTPPLHGSVALNTLTGAGQAVTYTPASNYNGPDSFAFTVTQGTLTSAPAVVTLTVTAVNDPPVATSTTVNTPQGIPIQITLTGTDPENNPLTFALTGNNLRVSGTPPTVTYTPRAGFTGTDTFDFTANDGALTSTPGTITVVVGPPPSGSADVGLGALADSADPIALRTNVTYSATAHNNGPASATLTSLTLAYPASGLQFVSFTASQGTCTPGVTITCAVGTLASGADATVTATFKAINQTGSVTVTGSVSASPFDYNTTNNLLLQQTTVNPNQAPTATTDAPATNEDTPATISVLSNDSDPENDVLSVTAVTPPSHGTAVKNANNTVTYTPAGDYFGPDSFTYTIDDGGNTAIGTVNVTVNPVNDAPSFTKGPDQNTQNTVGAQSIAAWATNISAGPANESAQVVNFIVSNNNNALFAAQPAVSPTGTLTYTPAAAASGSATVTVRLHDNGATAGGGSDTSAPQTFAILVTTSSADLGITKTHTAGSTAVGQPLTYTLTVANAGPDSAANVTVTDPLPASLTYVSATPSQGSCDQAGGTVTCSLGSIAKDANATVTLIATPTAAQPVTNTASVSSPTADANSGNNSASDPIVVGVGSCSVPTFHFAFGDDTAATANVIATGDFNKDGHLDAAVIDATFGFLRVFLADVANPGNYNHTDYPLGLGTASSLVVRDFDGDGNLDIAVAIGAGANSSIALFRGSALGAFSQRTANISSISVANPTVVTTSAPHGLTNGQTIAITGSNSTPTINGFRVVTVTGPTTFTVPVNVTASGNTGAFSLDNTVLPNGPQFPEAADLNGDGRPDLVVGFNATTISVLLWNTATGTFASPVSYGSGPSSGSNIIIDDFDGNGTLDIATPNVGAASFTILRGNGDGTFITPGTTVGTTYNVVRLRKVGDVNGDGRVDLGATLATTTTLGKQNLALFYNSGGLTFAGPVEILPESYAVGFFALADVTGDGKRDLVASSGVTGLASVLVLPGDDTGNFATPLQPQSFGTAAQFQNGQQSNFEIVDVNGDGKLDVIGIGPVADGFYVLENTCGTATTADLSLAISDPGPVAAGSTAAYTLTVTNNGPGAANAAGVPFGLNVLDYFDGDTIVSAAGATPSDAFTCDWQDSIFLCWRDTPLPAGASATITVQLKVFSGAHTTRATVTALEADPNNANNNASVTTTPVATPLTFVVTSTAAAGAGSLRQAILESNANVGPPGSPNTISFNIPGPGPTFTIAPTLANQLASIITPVIIDGTTQQAFMGAPCAPGAACPPIVELSGGSFGGVNGLTIATSGSTVRGLALNQWTGGSAINLTTSTTGGNTIAGNYIGTNVSGTGGVAANFRGINITSPNNVIGGTTAADRNVISGNGAGGGILVTAQANGASIVTSGAGTIIEGNFIGLGANGTTPVVNSGLGISAQAPVTIGGTTPGARNVIAHNFGNGVLVGALTVAGTTTVVSSGAGSVIRGNYIGLRADGTGTASQNNTAGITINAPNVTVGGTTVGAGNVISSNTGVGISVSAQTATINNVISTVSDGSGTVIQGNYIGTNPGGSAASPNVGNGVTVSVPNVTVGGTSPPPPTLGVNAGAGNLISGNGSNGIGGSFVLGSGNAVLAKPSGLVVQGNYIGTDSQGLLKIANTGTGVNVAGANSLIGGTTAGVKNVVAGNGINGISVAVQVIANTATVATDGGGSIIQGNFVGVKADGSGALGNTSIGVTAAAPATIGGTTAAARNVISGNTGGGISIGPAFATVSGVTTVVSSGAGSVIQGNFIGTNPTASAAFGNSNYGVQTQAPNVTIGGGAAGAGNVIAGNVTGIAATVSASGGAQSLGSSTIVQGNVIGTNAGGAIGLGNSGDGISLSTTGNQIGGLNSGEGNVISGNQLSGVNVNSSGNTVRGNLIGTDPTGTAALPNVFFGVQLNSANNNTIGGTTAGARNVISGNGFGSPARSGIGFFGTSSGNSVIGNYIGTKADGTSALPNANHGIAVNDTAFTNTFGGAAAGAGNVIAFNAANGINLSPSSGTGNAIRANSIHSNGGLGIDVGGGGVTPNDVGDGDPGPNNFQNFPVLTTASLAGGTMTIAGSLNSASNATFNLDFFASPSCDASTYGEGARFFGTAPVTTDNAGNASFSVPYSFPAGAGSVITATATDAGGNTSEFSQCISNNQAPAATTDAAATPSGTSLTLAPASNDTDPDNPTPAIIASFPLLAPGQPSLLSPGVLAFVPSTGNLYANAGPGFGVIDTTTNAITSTIAYPTGAAARIVNTATDYVYLRANTNQLIAIDGHAASPTFNSVVVATTIGAVIQSFALDQPRGLLYVLNQVNLQAGSLFESQIAIVDVNPASATFHQVVDSVVMPNNQVGRGVAVNSVTNTIWIGTGSGVFAMNGTTKAMTAIANTGNSFMPAVNELTNLVYVTTSAGGNGVHAIDGATNTRLATIPLPGLISTNFDRHIAIHNASGRVYVVATEFPAPSRVTIIDGNPANGASFNTIKAQVPIGREDAASEILVDQTGNRVVVTADIDFQTTILDTTTDAKVTVVLPALNPIPSSQAMIRAEINPTTHTAYVASNTAFLQVIALNTATLAATIPMGGLVAIPTVNPNTQQAFVSETTNTSTVAVFDQSSQLAPVTGLFTTDGQYQHIAVDATQNRIYVVGGASFDGGAAAIIGSSFVAAIDGATRAVFGGADAGNFPIQIAVDETANRVFVGNTNDGGLLPGGVTVIDGATGDTWTADLSAIPLSPNFVPNNLSVGRDVVVNPTTGKAYFRITNASPNTIAVLKWNAATSSYVATPLNGFTAANIIRVNPALNRIYVGDIVNNQIVVHVLDGSDDHEITTVTVGGNTGILGGTQAYLAVNPTTGHVWVANVALGTVSVINPATNAVLATIAAGRGPNAVAIDHTTNHVYVANWIDGTITIIDGATFKVISTVTLPFGPGPNCPQACGQLRITANPGTATFYASWTGESGTQPVLMIVSDPPNANGPLSVISTTQGLHGTVTINADGTVTYSPTVGYSGPDSYTYTVGDGHGGTAVGTVNVTVNTAIAITTASLPNSTVGASYPTQTLSVTGGAGPYTWTVPNVAGQQLPSGLSLSKNGVLAGKTIQSGTFTFTVQVRDAIAASTQFATATYTIVVGPPVIPTALPNPTANVLYSQQLTVGGATGAVTWALNTNGSPLLSWLSLSSSGLLTGTPPTIGALPSFTVSATDSLNQIASRSYSLTVGGALDIVPTTLREGVVLESGYPALPIVGGNGTKAVTLTAGTLPPGIALTSSGGFTGSPTRHGTFTFTVQVQDCISSSCAAGITQQTISRNLTWRVSPKDQQGGSTTAPTVAIAFGGAGGRKIAQTITVGAHGTLTGIGLRNISCPSSGPVTVDIQRLTAGGLPDGATIASGTTIGTLSFGSASNAISISPTVDLPIDARFAFVISSPTSCTLTNAGATDQYNAGDAYDNSGGGGAWVPLINTADARYDVPSFVTLIQPAIDVAYTVNFHGSQASATLLNSGKVLLAGTGNVGDLYDPVTNAATATGTMVSSPQRFDHAAVLLPDGTVLLVGGRDNVNTTTRLATAEIYNPANGTFTAASGTMSVARQLATATLLANGKVLVAGGSDGTTTQQSAELYDPTTKTFGSVSTMTQPRQQHAAILLASGKVLLVGGFGNSATKGELYDPTTNTFAATTGVMSLGNRGRLAAALLNDGRVLITGGQSGDIRAEAEIYDPGTDAFSPTGSMLSKRYIHAATTLADGSVLVAGGFDQVASGSYILPLATTERWIPGTGTFVAAASMETRREAFTATRLQSNKVLLAGGGSQSWLTGNAADVYDLTTTPTLTTTSLPSGAVGSAYGPVTLAAGGGSGGPYQIAQISGQLPANIGYNASTFTLSGTPTVDGLFAVGFQVTDSANHTSVQTLSIRIGTPLVITSPFSLTSGAVNHSYSYQLAATGSGAITWALAPASAQPPAGLSVGATGLITGIPTAAGGGTFVVRAADATGQIAYKAVNINIQSPLSITTTSLSEGVLFEGYGGCLGASNGVGTRTWSVSAGSLPPGVSLAANGCFSGPVGAFGTFNFTAQVTDQASPPQTATQSLGIAVLMAPEQSSAWDPNQPAVTFGPAGAARVAERVIAGATGNLRAVRIYGNSICPAGTIVTAEVQGVAPNGGPDGNILASGSATYSFNYIQLTPTLFFAADQQFTIVFSANAACTIRPATNDSNPGEGYVSNGSWQRLRDVDGRFDIGFQTLIVPAAGLKPTNKWHGAHTQITLGDGRVLIAGGDATAEIYDPATGTFTTTGAMSVPRQDATGTLLNDGTVLITGGAVYGTPGTYYSSAEIFHPNTGTFELLGSQMSSLRTSHAATKLTDGRVLITGGSYRDANNTYFTVKKADLYDPSTKTFTPVNDTLLPRERHTSTLLQDGRVLIAGGFGAGREAETYDPITFTFTATTQQMLPGSGSGGQTATLLADGRVLLTGGYGTFGMATTIAQFFDPIAGSFSSAGNLLSPRSLHTATTLANGNILIAAGQNDGACCTAQPGSASVEIYVPGTGFSPAGSLLATRYQHRASVVGSKVLFTGTWGWSAIAGQSGELYDPAITIGLANANFPDGTSGQAYGPLALQGFGGTPTYTVTLASGALPPGLSLTNNAIGGTPTASGTFSFSLSIADSASHSATQAFSIRIDAIVITTASFPTAYVGVPYLTGFSATGVGATTWSLVPNSGSPPPGLTLHANGTIDGTPLQTGFYNFRVQAVDSIGQATQVSRAISVVQPLQITTAYMDDPVPLWNYGWCLGANGGSGPRTWSVVGGTLAPGLSLGANGCFTGQPVKTGSFTFSVQVTDGVQPSTPVQFTHHVGTVDQAVWNIDPQPAPPAIAFGGGVELAQVFKTQMAGVLFGMGFPVACDPNVGLHLEIRGVTAGQPNASVLATSDFPAARVGAFTGPIYYRDLPLTTPLSVTRLTNLAAVLSAPGTCRVTAAQADTQSFTNSNPFGDAFTGSTGSWTALSTSDPTRPDVPFFSFVSDGGVLDFMSTGRNEGTATILPTGSNAGLVLLAGGYTETTQLYNPTTQTINGVLSGRFAASGSLTHLRAHHTATVLPDGWVLVVGGRDDTTGLSTAELYNPNSGTWSSTGQMSTARQGHTATLLSGNRVLIAGGQVDWFAPGLSSTEIFQYDPSTHTGQFSAGPSMAVGRAQHQAVTLNDARVLFSGGWGATLNATAELFTDSGAGSFGPTAGAMQTARADHTATLLSNGKVLIAGGWQIFVNAAAQTGELFDPQTNTFANVGANAARRNHLAARLNDGRVVLAGGDDGAGNPLFTVDVFDPVAATFATAHELVVARGGITGTHLANDKVLAVGGYGPSSTVWQSSELLDPANLFGAAVLPPLDGVAPPKPFAVTLNARAEERAVWSGPACRAPDAEGFRPPAFGTAAVGFTAPVLIDVAVGESPPQQQY